MGNSNPQIFFAAKTLEEDITSSFKFVINIFYFILIQQVIRRLQKSQYEVPVEFKKNLAREVCVCAYVKL